MNVRETAEVLGYLASAWPRYELTEETVKVWVDQFSHVDFEVAQRAAKALVASDEWFPSVARFRELVSVELRKTPPKQGCEKCDRGFTVLDDGSVTFCRFCRPDLGLSDAAELGGGQPVRELGSGKWETGIESARRKLLPKVKNINDL